MNNLEETIQITLKFHLEQLLKDEKINFNYNDLEDLKDDLMYGITSYYKSKI